MTDFQEPLIFLSTSTTIYLAWQYFCIWSKSKRRSSNWNYTYVRSY